MQNQDFRDVTLGNVRLMEPLGKGAMGTVYRAEHTALNTPYAVKILHAELSKDEVVAERFRREAMMCSKLRHPNIVFVTDFGFHPDVGLYLVMEYLTGHTLKSLLEQHKSGLPLWRAVDIMQQLCDAFSTAHEAGVIHRDLKPENIFVVETRNGQDLVKVLDFGIARLTATEDGELTRQGQLIGTPSYMSPEQINASAPISAQTDIYALGILLYELIAGRPPFEATNPMELMAMHMMQHLPPLSIHRQELKGTILATLISEMVSKDPKDRPSNTTLIRQRLTYALQELQQQGIDDAFGHQRESTDLHHDVSEIDESIVVPRANGTEQYHGSQAFALSGVLSQLNKTPNTASYLSKLYTHLPELEKLPADMFFLASWGPVVRDLVDTEPETPVFSQALEHLGILLESLLTSPQHTSEQVQQIQHLIRSSIQELMAITSQDRHLPILSAFKHLTTHYLFPHDALPDWAQAQTSGTWMALRSVLTSDIRDLFKKKR